jgi:HD-GYP domain-containing protein (c-di-GMP phosphodiesterase class II)
MARILSIVDSFDAMVSVRPYRDRRSVKVTLKTMQIEQHSGQWDAELLGYFMDMMSSLAEEGVKLDD